MNLKHIENIVDRQGQKYLEEKYMKDKLNEEIFKNR